MSSKNSTNSEHLNEQSENGLGGLSRAFLFATSDLVYVLQDGKMVLNTESQKYTNGTGISFEDFLKNENDVLERSHLLETQRRNRDKTRGLHKSQIK